MSNTDPIINDIISIEEEFNAKVRKRIYDVAKYLLPALGLVGILVTALTAHLDADVSAYVLGGFAILSGLVHALASNNTDPALYSPNVQPHVDIPNGVVPAAPSASASPSIQTTAGGTSGSNLGGTPPSA